jgi:hypothetical protein
MNEILAMILPWGVTTYLLFALVAWDEARLAQRSPEALARAWPASTRTMALVYFGVLSLPVHFGRTRRSVLGVLQGLGWATALFLLDDTLADWVDALVRRLSE